MKSYDVIIVGGGPAGAAAAKTLKDSHLSYCIIEKYRYPRKKLCAGGLTNKSVRLIEQLGFDIEDIDRYNCDSVMLVSKDERAEIGLDAPIVMVDRLVFDEVIVRQGSTGDNLFDGERVTSLDTASRTLTTDKDEYNYRYLIFADGVNGFSNRLIPDRQFGFSAECDSPTPYDRMVIDFNALKDGYGWIFPKNGHTTVGLGRIDCSKDDYSTLLEQFAAKYDLQISRSDIRGFRLPNYSDKVFRNSVIDHSVILTGDAASLVDNASGEGISYALMSGMYAAQSIIEAIENDTEVDGIYFAKTVPIAEALKKRLKISRMIYSPMGSFFIKQGLHNDAAIEKIKRIFC